MSSPQDCNHHDDVQLSAEIVSWFNVTNVEVVTAEQITYTLCMHVIRPFQVNIQVADNEQCVICSDDWSSRSDRSSKNVDVTSMDPGR